LNKEIQSLQTQNKQKQLELAETQTQLNAMLQERQQLLAEIENQKQQSQTLLAETQAQLNTLIQEHQQLLAEMENQKQQTQTLLAETQQKEKHLAGQAEQLQTHLAQMENQLQELSEQAVKEKTELQALVQDYQARLEKTDHLKRETENRMAAIQAHNDRLLAGEQEAEQLREQLLMAQQKNDALNRQLERLKGDHQLVGEENNQLHQLLRLRDQEMERMHLQMKELKEKTVEAKKLEVVVSPEEMEMLHDPSLIPQETETSDVETKEIAKEQTEIPSFNLAEQIMAEQRKAVASQRQAPAAQSQASRKDAVQKMVNQFVGTPEPAQTPAQPCEERQVKAVPESPAQTSSTEDLTPVTAGPSSDETLIAEIVRRDITLFLEAKKQTFQKTVWMWKSN
jgi:chromosome segregation ATPase